MPVVEQQSWIAATGFIILYEGRRARCDIKTFIYKMIPITKWSIAAETLSGER